MTPKIYSYIDFNMQELIVTHACTDGISMEFRHLHSQYEILFIKRGSVTVDSNADTLKLQAPCIVIHKPFHLHRANAPTGTPYERYVINIAGELLAKIKVLIPHFSLLDASQATVVPLNDTLLEKVDQSFREIHKDANEGRNDYALLKIALMLLSLSEYAAEKGIVAPENASYIAEVVRYISLHYADDIKIDRLADQFFVSRSKLISDFKNTIGVTIKKYIMFIRINNAQYLLSEGHSISETATLCGFYDSSHFISTFRSLTDMTPKEFLKKKDS